MTYLKNDRDANEAGLVQFWRAMGCHWIPMDRHKGFDGLLVARNGVHIVEIKNPARRWNYTPAEVTRKVEVEKAGGVYNTIETDEQARKLIGL